MWKHNNKQTNNGQIQDKIIERQTDRRMQTEKEKVKGKNKWIGYVIAAAAILMTEIFLWNHSFWLSLGYEPISVQEVYTQMEELLPYQEDFCLEPDSYLEIRDIGCKIKNIYLNIETNKDKKKDVLTIRLQMADEGRKAYYSSSARVVSSKLQKLNYISLYPYGDLRSLRIEFPGEENTTIRIKDITFNSHVPFFFSVWRVILMYLFFLIGKALFFQPFRSYRKVGSRRQRLVATGVCVLFMILVFLLIEKGESSTNTMNKYTDLTHAISKGMVSLDIDVNKQMFKLNNPYDRTERAEQNLEFYYGDYAYYEGKLYVYFGVVPVVLTYLPYYLLTGQDLSHITAYLLFLLPLIVGAFSLVDMLAKKYCKWLPEKLYYLFQVTFMLGIGTFVFVKSVRIYNLAIMAGLCFTVWGLYLWMGAIKEREKYVIWKVFFGSVCMALVAGCRPQLVVGSFLAFPIFGEKCRQIFIDLKKKNKINNHIFFLMAFSIPFLVVAILLMWYNYARFGSVFDFGVSYNLTTNDMRFRGIHMARMVAGLWAFLFELPRLNIEFPFLEATWMNTSYQGLTIQEACIGGIFATNIILLPCFLLYKCRVKLRKGKALLFAVICTIDGLIIACADVQMAGVLTRYKADFAIFFYIASFLIIFSILDAFHERKSECSGGYWVEAWYKVFATLSCVTIIYCFITFLSLYEPQDYNITEPVWYFHLKEIFGVFDI